MKKLLPLSAAVLGLTACGPIEFESTKRATFSVHSSDPTDTTYDLKQAIDLQEDPDFAQYKENIQSVEVTSATVRIINSPSETPSNCTTASGTLLVAGDEGAQGVKLATYENVSLAQGTTIDVTVEAAGAAELAKYASNTPFKFTVTAEGTTDQAPCHFDLEVELAVKATGSLF